MPLTLKTAKKLNNGSEIPVFGLGTWQMPDGLIGLRAMLAAFEAGYRHIDTAAMYGNEETVGEALRESGLGREDVFITTKVWNSDHGYQETLRACESSLSRLRLDYVDLYLIHWPVPELRHDTWRACEKLLEDGKAMAIGVSNYMVHHLRDLFDHSDLVPAVNQIELHPYNYLSRRDVVELCEERQIAVEAYCPLAQGRRLNDPVIGTIGQTHEKSPAQILLRWSLQHGWIAIPKSVRPERIVENADIFDFDLTDQEMRTIDQLDENLVTTWDPTDAP